MKRAIAGACAPLMGLVALAGAAEAGGMKDNGYGPAATPKSTVSYSGSGWSKDSSYFYSGVLFALNGDLGKDGFLLRGFAGVPMYEYDSASAPGGVVDGDGLQGDLMIGYMWHREHMTFSGYVGVEYQDYDLTPNDPTADINGSEVGFKVAADLSSAYASPFYFNLHGSYSTAFDSYWTRARIGYNSGRFVIGPEVIAMGNEGFEARRLGGFATVRFELTPALTSEVSVNVGHQFVDEDKGHSSTQGGDGTYAGIGLSLVF